jgi:hypothetical protein
MESVVKLNSDPCSVGLIERHLVLVCAYSRLESERLGACGSALHAVLPGCRHPLAEAGSVKM